jgi:hypothetical protein
MKYAHFDWRALSLASCAWLLNDATPPFITTDVSIYVWFTYYVNPFLIVLLYGFHSFLWINKFRFDEIHAAESGLDC